MSYVPQHRDLLVAAAARLADEAQTPAPPARRRRPVGRLSTPLLAVLVIACVPAVVAATMVARHAASPDHHVPGGPRPPVERHPGVMAGRPPAAALLRTFSVLRRPQRAGDAFGPGEDVGTSRYFADQIRRVQAQPPLRGPGRPVPGVLRVAGAPDGRVCVFLRPPPPAGYRGAYGAAGTCQRPSAAAEGRLAFHTAMSLVGLVPDDIRRVRVTLIDGRVSILPVVDNVFSVRLAYPARRFAFDGPDGPVVRRLIPGG